MKAVCVHETGGPEKLIYQDMPAPLPGPGQALVKIHSIGLNFIDVYFRKGLYKSNLPFVPGMEAAGIVEGLGDGVSGIKQGDRVAYAGTIGSYAEYVSVDSEKLVRLPDSLNYESASAVMLQGMTAHYLTHSTYPLKSPGSVSALHPARAPRRGYGSSPGTRT